MAQYGHHHDTTTILLHHPQMRRPLLVTRWLANHSSEASEASIAIDLSHNHKSFAGSL